VLLKEALTTAIDRLTAAHVGSPRMNAEVLLMFILGRERAYLYAHPEQDLSPQDIARYDEALSQRSQGVPAQYITGHQEFWGMDLVVSPAVLIPRRETEHVIETVLPLAKTLPKPRIVDVGAGSGAIVLALAKELLGADLHATELSAPALEIARANAARHQLESRIHFHETDLLTGLDPESFDFVVSNPPYVGESEADQVQLEVRKFEPQSAVFAGPTGLEVIRRLVPQAHAVLKPEGWLIVEISGTIVEGVRRLLEDWRSMQIVDDLQGIPRVAAAQKLP
jgi:release factor glutamine methyltransferase